MTKEQCAYLAGIVDGEGTISICVNRMQQGENAYAMVMRVYNSNIKLCNWVQETTGIGKVTQSCIANSFKNPKHKPVFQWATSSNGMREILPHIIPYLIIKKELAELAYEWLSRYGRKKLGGFYLKAEDHLWKKKTYLRMREINKRGISI